MPDFLQLLLVMLLHLAAGWVVYIYLLNRSLNRMRTSRLKLALQVGSLAFFTLVSLGLGWLIFVFTTGWRQWFFPLAVGLIFLAGDLRLAWQRRSHRGAPPVAVEPPRRSGMAFLRQPLTTTDLTTLTYELDWDGPPLKAVHLTDLHLNEVLELAYFQRAIALANQQAPDLILLSGDFVTHSHEIPLLPGLLSQLHTTARLHSSGIQPGRAIFASLGNHDYWSDPIAIRRTLDELAIPVLSGRCQEAWIDGGCFRLCADDRPWGPGLEQPAANPRAAPALVLSHSPDNIYRLARQPGVTAVFSGHVHAGQFRLPLPWSGSSTSLILPSSYGRRFDNGHFTFSGAGGKPVHLFVSAGIGAAEPPLRIYCPPEILVVRLKDRSMGSHL